MQSFMPLLDMSTFGSPSDFYIDGAVSCEIERRIARTLPLIPALDSATSDESRRTLLSNTAQAERARFVHIHSHAFGCDEFEGALLSHNRASHAALSLSDGVLSCDG
jgi:hypothetical protein